MFEKKSGRNYQKFFKIKAISHLEKASKILSSKKLDILAVVTGLKRRNLTEIFR